MSLLLLLRPKYPRAGRLPITYVRTQPKPKPRRITYVDAFVVAESSSTVNIAAEVTYNFDTDVEELVLSGAI